MRPPRVCAWTCPACGERVPTDIYAQRVSDGSGAEVRVCFPESAMTDAYVHVWAHQEAELR